MNIGDCCLWAGNDAAEDKYGIETYGLPISSDLANTLDELVGEWATVLNWAEPNSPSPWTSEQKIKFISDTTIAYKRLCGELGEEYEIIDRNASYWGIDSTWW